MSPLPRGRKRPGGPLATVGSDGGVPETPREIHDVINGQRPLFSLPWMLVQLLLLFAGTPCAGTSSTVTRAAVPRAGEEPVPDPLHPGRNSAPPLPPNLMPLIQMLPGESVSALIQT